MKKMSKAEGVAFGLRVLAEEMGAEGDDIAPLKVYAAERFVLSQDRRLRDAMKRMREMRRELRAAAKREAGK